MNHQKSALALAFLQSQPSSAAGVLEQQPIEHVASFLKDVPFKQAAIVLQKMLPQYTARLCSHLDPAIAAAFLSEMEISQIAAVFRHSQNEVRIQVLEQLPERIKLVCNILLSYPETAVGAWMVTNVITIPSDCHVEEAIARLSFLENMISLDTIYIVNRQQKIEGAVNTTHLLKSAAHKSIKSIMETEPVAISARTSLSSVANDSIWQQIECAAVVNKDRQIIGAFRHLDLRRGLQEISNTISEPRGNDPITGILDVYGSCLLALFNTVSESLNVKKP